MEEQHDILALIAEVKAHLDRTHAPQGYNVGFNAGAAAGQTVPHLHVHIIPRYDGDVPDPRGGVRHVIPQKGNYLATPTESHAFHFADGVDAPLLDHLLDHLQDPGFDRVDLVVSFVLRSGLGLVHDGLADALERGADVRVLTTDYLNYTEPGALAALIDLTQEWPDKIAIRVFSDHLTSFHPKGYLFHSTSGDRAAAIVGSSNLSRSGLSGGIEWNLGVANVEPMLNAFDRLWDDSRSRPLDDDWLDDYRRRRPDFRGAPPPLPPPTDLAAEPVESIEQPVEPRPIQRDALDALEATRAAGHRAGLVVMATGLGKTWLAAFDTARPAYRRVLFVAHREEILRQSLEVFRRVQPEQHLGIYMGTEKQPNANVVFASVQTLVRHLDAFPSDRFDYVVVDEFHHAAASSYRQVIDHFDPAFLLGLTATPERMDGADLLSLCGDNLAFQCDLVEGIDRGELVPFRYHGIRDVVDFAPIPWRNGRFDPQALTDAVETHERAEHALREWRQRAGARTIAFCSTTTHADFMARYFAEQGLRTAAVHSGQTSAPRRATVQRLQDGDLDVLFAVDVFNEGFDLPAIDTVLMLRPTDSPVIFLQQLGRGLRLQEGKDYLTVVDFIGNHRSFLLKPRALLGLGTGTTPSNDRIREALESGEWNLPEGCSVNWQLEAIELLGELAAERQRQSPASALVEFLTTHMEEFGERATAMQALRSGLNPASATRSHGGWFGLLDELDQATDDESRVWRRHKAVLGEVETTKLTRSYKLVLLRALIHDGTLLTGADLDQIAATSHEFVKRDPRLVRDATSAKDMPDPLTATPEAWARLWNKQPVAALTGEYRADGHGLFRVEEGRLVPRFDVADGDAPTFVAMVAELVEWRLAEYLLRDQPATSRAIECTVSHSSGSPIVRFDRRKHPDLPQGPTSFLAGGERYEGNFVKIALNTASTAGEKGNALHSLLRGWFGPAAGLPGSRHRVLLEQQGGDWVMRPLNPVGQSAEHAIPFFPTYDVACGAFAANPAAPDVGAHLEITDQHGRPLDPEREFVAVAQGDSMAGGPDPVHAGDLLLMRWVRDRSREDLVGERVLVEYDAGPGPTSALKTLDRDGSGYVLRSTNPAVPPINATSGMRVVAEFTRRLDQREFNPLADRIGEPFKRSDIAPLYGQVFNPGNWNSGHVSLGDDVVLFITLDKGSMANVDYEDHFEGPGILVWASQNSVGPGSKKGREILDAPADGRRIHVWVRRRKADVAFEYRGLVTPIGHQGDRPMSVRFRLLTTLTDKDLRRLQG